MISEAKYIKSTIKPGIHWVSVKGEYFNIWKLSHDPDRSSFFHLPTLAGGFTWEKRTAISAEHPSQLGDFSGRLRSWLTSAVHFDDFQGDSKIWGLPVHTPKASVWLWTPRECCYSLPYQLLLLLLSWAPTSLAGAELVPEKLSLMTCLWRPHSVLCLCFSGFKNLQSLYSDTPKEVQGNKSKCSRQGWCFHSLSHSVVSLCFFTYFLSLTWTNTLAPGCPSCRLSQRMLNAKGKMLTLRIGNSFWWWSCADETT